jgi:DNA-binding transcriptional ArsR family regulator
MLPNGRQESKPGPRPTASPSYDPENEGAWDGQLPNPDLVHQALKEEAPKKTRRKNPNWPNLLMRMQWAYERTVAMGLTGVEASILKHVCFIDGIGEGFFQNQENTVKETGWSHATVSRALASLTEKGLLEAKRRMGRTTKYTLLGLATMPSEPISERDDYVSLRDGVELSKRQQNPEGNQEDLTLNSPTELSERREFKNLQGTGDQDQDEDDLPVLEGLTSKPEDESWRPPPLAPKLFRNPMAYAQFVGAFQSGELTREWAHALSQHGGGMTPQETWAYEEWFDKTHRITAPGNYEKLIEDNIRRYQEEHGLAPGDPKVEAVGAALDAG